MLNVMHRIKKIKYWVEVIGSDVTTFRRLMQNILGSQNDQYQLNTPKSKDNARICLDSGPIL